MIHLLFPHSQNGWYSYIKKFKQAYNISKYQIYRDSAKLPSVMNKPSNEGLLNMQSEIYQRERTGEKLFLVVNIIVIKFK